MNILNEYLNEYIEDFSKANQFAPGKRYFSILYVTFQSIILCVSSVCGLVPTSLNVGEPSAHPRTFSLLCQHARLQDLDPVREFDCHLHSDTSKIYIHLVLSPNIQSSR